MVFRKSYTVRSHAEWTAYLLINAVPGKLAPSTAIIRHAKPGSTKQAGMTFLLGFTLYKYQRLVELEVQRLGL